MDSIRPDRQTVMFSATFPRQMEALARKILQKPIEVQVGGRSVVCKDVDQNVVGLSALIHQHCLQDPEHHGFLYFYVLLTFEYTVKRNFCIRNECRYAIYTMVKISLYCWKY